jgi:hypothetical protein
LGGNEEATDPLKDLLAKKWTSDFQQTAELTAYEALKINPQFSDISSIYE